MARGKKASNVIFFQLRSDTDNGKPVFLVQSGETKNEAHYVSGRITNIFTKTVESKKGPFTQVKLYMHDGEERYILSFSMTILGRSILNSLINKKSIDTLSVNLYKNKHGKPSVHVEVNGKKAERAYDKETIEKKYVKKGVFDIDAFDTLLLGHIDGIKDSLTFQEEKPAEDGPDTSDVEHDKELPF